MLKKLLILSVFSFSVFSQAEVSLIQMIKKRASVQKIQSAIEQGANVNEQNSLGFTPLITAAANSRPEIISALLEAGANVNARTKYKETALIWAASNENDLEVVKLLLEAGADVNARNGNGETALMHAAFFTNAEVVKLLLQYGANVNERDTEGRTALTHVYNTHSYKKFWGVMLSKKDYKATVQALKQAGATE